MKRSIICIIVLLFTLTNNQNCMAVPTTKAFILKKDDNIITEGDITIRYSPCSTFKIFISLMGYEEGILLDDKLPIFENPKRDSWESEFWPDPTYNPSTWMKQSVVWYSQNITQRLGMEKFQEYVSKCRFGNLDLSGDLGKDNGLTKAWLSSSLKVSAAEQVGFLDGLTSSRLPFRPESIEKTRKLVDQQISIEGWKLFGKTGSGYSLNCDESKKSKIGWFIGWLEKGDNIITFAYCMEDEFLSEGYLSPIVKEKTIDRLKGYLSGIKTSPVDVLGVLLLMVDYMVLHWNGRSFCRCRIWTSCGVWIDHNI